MGEWMEAWVSGWQQWTDNWLIIGQLYLSFQAYCKQSPQELDWHGWEPQPIVANVLFG